MSTLCLRHPRRFRVVYTVSGVQHPRAQYQYIKGPVTCVPSGPLDVGASVTPPTRNGSVRAVDAAAATVRGYAGHRDDVEIIKAETYAERISRLGQVTTSHPHETVRSREVHPTGRNASGVTHHRGGSACAPRTAECPAHTHAGASQSRKESNWSHAESGRTSLDLRGRGREDHAGRRQKESVASNADAGNGIETDRRRRSPLRPKTASSIRRAIARVRRGSSGGDNSSCERSAQRLQHRDGRPRACSVSPLRMRHSLTTLSTAEEVEAIGGGWHAGGSMVDNTGGVGGLTASIGNGKNTCVRSTCFMHGRIDRTVGCEFHLECYEKRQSLGFIARNVKWSEAGRLSFGTAERIWQRQQACACDNLTDRTK